MTFKDAFGQKLSAYLALHDVAVRNKEDIDTGLFYQIERELEQAEKSVEFGMELDYAGCSYYRKRLAYGKEAIVALYGESEKRSILWSDDGRQPENEWLCCISFPTGPYIFGDYFQEQYPKQTFDLFFEELKSFGTAYCDTHNNNLYFTANVARDVCEAFEGIFEKYKAVCKEEFNRKRVKQLESELARLKSTT